MTDAVRQDEQDQSGCGVARGTEGPALTHRRGFGVPAPEFRGEEAGMSDDPEFILRPSAPAGTAAVHRDPGRARIALKLDAFLSTSRSSEGPLPRKRPSPISAPQRLQDCHPLHR